jgi:hypothetical protein
MRRTGLAGTSGGGRGVRKKGQTLLQACDLNSAQPSGWLKLHLARLPGILETGSNLDAPLTKFFLIAHSALLIAQPALGEASAPLGLVTFPGPLAAGEVVEEVVAGLAL